VALQRTLAGQATFTTAARPTCGIVYGMNKTTIYLPDDLKAKLQRASAETGRSEADLIREGIVMVLSKCTPPTPTIPLYVSDDPEFVLHIDDHLAGFGER
jgi:hypothetical protein